MSHKKVSCSFISCFVGIYRIGEIALCSLNEHIENGLTQRKSRLPAEPVYRRSCGCFCDEIRNARITEKKGLQLQKEEIIERVADVAAPFFNKKSPAYPGDEKVRLYFVDLLDSLVWDVEKASIREIFLNEVDMLLFKFEECSHNALLLNQVLTELSNCITSIFPDTEKLSTASGILQQGLALIREHRLNFAQTNFLQDTLFQLMIRETSQSIITTFEQRKLLKAISASFPELNINSLVFAIYKKDDPDVPLTSDNWDFPENSQLLLGYDRKRNILFYPRGDSSFKTRDLFPPDMFDSQNCKNYIFMPLFFEDEHLGFSIFEYSKGVPLFMYEELRLHMSSALKSSFLMKELRVQSMLDDLTGLHNRRGFMIEAKKMVRLCKKNEQRIMMFYADMDDLKLINDNYGHEEGDIAISGAAAVLKQTFREGDLVARIGGDEFVDMLIWQNEEQQDLEKKIMHRLSACIANYNQVIDKPYRVAISMGIAATVADEDINLDALMREADERLMIKKRAKNAGRTSVPGSVY